MLPAVYTCNRIIIKNAILCDIEKDNAQRRIKNVRLSQEYTAQYFFIEQLRTELSSFSLNL